MIGLTVNGNAYELEAPVGRTLAEALRLDLGLTGTKIACGEGHCGACTVQLDGVPVLSCITLVHTVHDRLVEARPEPTSDEVRHAMSGNLCRCGAYPRIEEAVLAWRG